MTLERIGDVVTGPTTWNPTKSRSTAPFHYIDIASVDSVEKSIVRVSDLIPAQAPSRARQLVRTGDILVSTVRPNLNAVAMVPPALDGATASTGFCVLRPYLSRIDGRYLFHWVCTPMFINAMIARATGASYPAISDRIVHEAVLPVPPLPKQRRIAAMLDKADAVRRKQRNVLKLVGQLPDSAFSEMFGDPRANEHRWDVVALDQVSQIVSGVTKGRKLPLHGARQVPYLRVANVQDGYLNLAEVKTIDATPVEIIRYRLRDGDILLTEGGDPDKLGRGAVWRGEVKECIHQNHIFRVRLVDDELIPDYVSALLGSAYGKRFFLRAAKQTTGIASINRTQLARFPVIRAPVELQHRYAALLGCTRGVAERVSAAGRTADQLYDALVARVFSG